MGSFNPSAVELSILVTDRASQLCENCLRKLPVRNFEKGRPLLGGKNSAHQSCYASYRRYKIPSRANRIEEFTRRLQHPFATPL
ncbi:Protein of unknown function [Pyronema omphalodes CBS 100304]|uniref:Uncharacterized protein n=1 Tax=Pyronema omphalodes (strain CBS 100304) TaxID=1076935 RepID=U4L4I0_PYROM|nr:Protein of unknown function [Pyronema omphalodes CBS 100304]